MKPFKRTGPHNVELILDELPWIPQDLTVGLSAVVSFLIESFKPNVSRIGLYGSWQRGDAGPESDVDIVVFLTHEVTWFDAENGMVNRSDARKEKLRWHTIERKANACHPDSRIYSIAVVTEGMIEYYTSKGPIHLYNWVHALKNCYPLWGNRSDSNTDWRAH